MYIVEFAFKVRKNYNFLSITQLKLEVFKTITFKIYVRSTIEGNYHEKKLRVCSGSVRKQESIKNTVKQVETAED